MSTTETNSTNDKPGEPATTKAATDKPHRSHRTRKESHHFFLPLLGLLLIAGIAGGAWLYRTISQYHVQQQDAINVLRDKVQTSQQQAEAHINTLQDRLLQQQQSQEELGDNLATLLKRNDHLRKDWLLGEAEYLLKLASYRLQLERDIPTALRAMQIADERLREIGDPSLLTVRKVLAEDQNALKNVPAADVSGMSLTLSALLNNVEKLPLSTPSPDAPQNTVAENHTDKTLTDWRDIPKAIWEEIKSLVRIRQHDTNIAALLGPKEQFYLLQNLQLQLEQARLALLLGKGNVFAERMQTAQDWLQRFFDMKDPAVQNTLQTLQQLAGVNIEPEIPVIDKSYQTLRTYIAAIPVVESDLKKDKPAPAPKNKPAVKQVPDSSEKKTGEKIDIEGTPNEKSSTTEKRPVSSNKVQP